MPRHAGDAPATEGHAGKRAGQEEQEASVTRASAAASVGRSRSRSRNQGGGVNRPGIGQFEQFQGVGAAPSGLLGVIRAEGKVAWCVGIPLKRLLGVWALDLQGKGALPGESFNVFRNGLTLGEAASPEVSDVKY